MRRALEIIGAVATALILLAVITIGALIGLNAECNSGDCPRSDGYRAALLAVPPTVAIVLVAGAAWSIRRRRLYPLALAEAGALGVVALVDATLEGPDVGTVVLGGVAIGIGVLVTRQRP
jgi:hypothetical protein